MVSKGTLAWSNIVAALGAAIVSTLVTAWYFKGVPGAKAPPTGLVSGLSGMGTLVAETITYIPHILLLFGVLADMFTMEGVYSIPSLIALIAIPLNYLMKYFWDGLGSIWVSIVELYNTKPSGKGPLSGITNPLASKPALPKTSPGNPFAAAAAAAPAPAPKPAAPKPAAGPKPPVAPAAPKPGVKNPLAPILPKPVAPILPKQSTTGNIPTYTASLLPDPGAGTGLANPLLRKTLKTYQTTKGRPANILLQKGGSIKDYNGCDVQGFSALHNKYAPQSLVITATVFMYYIFDLIMNRGWVDATAPIVVFAVVYAAETFIIGSCNLDSDGESFSTGVKSLISFIHGLIFGGTAYGVVSSYYPKSLPSRVLPDFPRKTAADLTRREDGTYVDENGSPWVILPNGNAIPAMSAGGIDVSTGGAVDETSTSTGSAATPGSCPGGNC